ncbi:MAG TPA: enoyl-CoA hydratase-related protein, partial [Terriglobales bacterium]|nr:enoyl-CoA hydratase-related protein [Terriglobales bacterium]
LLPRTLAMELALTGDPITAQRAYDLGLVNRLVDGPAIEGARELARTIAENGPLAVRAILASVRQTFAMPEKEAFDIEMGIGLPVFGSRDAKEGPRAFLEKRKPVFEGR